MTALALVFGALGTAVRAAGSIAQGQAAKRAADYNAAVDKQQATQAREASNAEASDYKRQQGRDFASSIAASGASGVATTGSPLMVDEATVREIALGASRLSYKGAVDSNRFLNQAQLDKMSGKASQTAGYIGAGTSLLNGFGNAAGYYA